MLAYRHAFHAGNRADVLKHVALTVILRAMLRKGTPLFYLDTHAGAGRYDLGAEPAATSAEFRHGIERVRAAAHDTPGAVPAGVQAYLDLVEAALRASRRPGYPGAAAIAQALLRESDRLVLVEQHPAEVAALTKCFAGGRNVQVVEGDGYARLSSLLPPREGRGLVLIDPAYELRAEPDRVVAGLREAFARFRHGTYLIWYPRAGKLDWNALRDRIRRLARTQLLDLTLGAPHARGGEITSGVLLVNPPWSALQELEASHRWLAAAVGDGAGDWTWLAGGDSGD
jgi:23S rRNA (adenine2030-N6)-methyltransferase